MGRKPLFLPESPSGAVGASSWDPGEGGRRLGRSSSRGLSEASGWGSSRPEPQSDCPGVRGVAPGTAPKQLPLGSLSGLPENQARGVSHFWGLLSQPPPPQLISLRRGRSRSPRLLESPPPRTLWLSEHQLPQGGGRGIHLGAPLPSSPSQGWGDAGRRPCREGSAEVVVSPDFGAGHFSRGSERPAEPRRPRLRSGRAARRRPGLPAPGPALPRSP